MSSKYIANRNLMCSKKGSSKQMPLKVMLSAPYLVEPASVSFPIEGECYGCRIDIGGIEEEGLDIYGVDAMQAINLASNLEPLLKRLEKKYDLFWDTGEPYFN